jgi:hypothetical protein
MFSLSQEEKICRRTLSVPDALRSFSIRTMVATKESELNKDIFNNIVSEQESSFLSTKFLF